MNGPHHRDVLIAAGECARVIGILMDSTTPHSKALAVIVGVRLRALLTGEAPRPEPLEQAASEGWLDIVEQLGDIAGLRGNVS